MDVSIEDILKSIGVSSLDVISHDGPVFANVFPAVDRQTAHWIDQQLDWQDAVSFAFLVVQKDDIALQLSRYVPGKAASSTCLIILVFRILERNKRNIINNQDQNNQIGIVQVINLSAEKHGAISWQFRVYQALFLIGYKKLLYDLGIDDEDAERKFHGGIQLKAERRLLFKLCQELEINDQARLVQLFQVCQNVSLNLLFLSLIRPNLVNQAKLS